MLFLGLRLDHGLEWALNFCAWKEWIIVELEDNKFIKQAMVPPQDPQKLVQHTKNHTKARRIILEGIRDHIRPHLHEKKTAYEMFKAILNLYLGSSDAKNLALKEHLRST